MDNDQIKNVTRKIKALLAKTVESGATEAEAMSAFTKAHELLNEYQLSLSDLDIREEGTAHIEKDMDIIAQRMSTKVGRYCECKVWKSDWVRNVKIVNRKKVDMGYYTKINFIGIKTDADFAEWLLFALTNYVAGQEMNFLFSSDNTNEYAGDDFISGCIKRINTRLQEEIDRRELMKFTSSGRDLVPLKNAMISEAFAKLGVNLVNSPGYATRIVDERAFAKGIRAGDGVSFNRPVHHDSTEQRLLK